MNSAILIALRGVFAISLVVLTTANVVAQDIRYGLQRGAMAPIRQSLPAEAVKQGIKYDYKVFNDVTSAILAMDQGHLEIANTSAQHVVRAIDEGMKFVLIVGWGGGYNVLVSRKDLGIQKGDFAGLKKVVDSRKATGKKLRFGVPTGSMQHLKLIYLLKQNGINADADIEILNIPFPNHPRALDAREVDMAMSLATFAAMSIHAGSGSLFHHLYGDATGKWEIGFAVRKDLADTKPDVVQKIVNSHVAAMNTFTSDVSKQVELDMKESSFPQPVIEMTQRDFLKHTYRITLDDIKATAKQMYDIGWAKKDHSNDIEKYVDFSFLEKATGESRDRLKGF